jgi:SNF2 family DNA or RNA helicase
VKMIANILDGNAEENFSNRPTLIVCPSPLCIQWFKEIEKHVQPGAMGAVIIYRKSKTCDSDPVAALSRYDVIITPYSEVTRSYPQFEQPKHLATEAAQREWWEKQYAEDLGILHKINFRRIVLDEAHVIKNHNSKVSLACRSLQGKYKWVLSGTPIQNSVDEFYPYFAFLGVAHTGSYATFKANYCRKGSNIGLQRLRVMLEKIMIRRTHEDEMFGRPLAKMPTITTETIALEFSAIERAIYNIVRHRFIAQIRLHIDEGTLSKSYRTILVYYLRLRQLVSHILLIQKTLKELLEAEDLEKLWRLCESEQQDRGDHDGTLAQLRTMLGARSPPPSAPLGEAHCAQNGLGLRFRQVLQGLCERGEWSEINGRSMCHKCGEIPQSPHVTSCMHVYCKECISTISDEASQRHKVFAMCVCCDSPFVAYEPCQGFEQATQVASTKTTGDAGGHVPSAEEDDSWLELGSGTISSTKTTAIRAQCQRWQHEDPDAKIVIFTQFRGMITVSYSLMSSTYYSYCLLTYPITGAPAGVSRGGMGVSTLPWGHESREQRRSHPGIPRQARNQDPTRFSQSRRSWT